MKEKFLLFILLLILFSIPVQAQNRNNVMRVESWETVTIDRSPRHIDSLIVKGTLIVRDRRNINISVGNIIIDGGTLQIGTPENPFRNKIAIYFNSLEDFPAANRHRIIVKNNGTLSLHGISGEKTTWTQLKNDLAYDSNTLQFKNITNWQRDDEIVITSVNDNFKNEKVKLLSAFNGDAVSKTTFQQAHAVKTLNFKEKINISPFVGLLTHTIKIGVHPNLIPNQINTQILIEDTAGNVTLSGVNFENIGTSRNTAPAIKWTGSKRNNYLKNSSFYQLKSDAVVLDQTSVLISNNVFFSNNGTVISCSMSGNGTNNQIINNLIIYNDYNNDSNESGIKTMNPFQTIRGNQIIGPRFSSGISYLLPRNKKNALWDEDSDKFRLEGNLIYNQSSLKSSNTGIIIEKFSHNQPWEIKNNTIVNYAKGVNIDTDEIRLNQFKSYNNTTGIISGSIHLSNAEILNPDKRLSVQSKAIDLNKISELKPVISGVTIDGYEIGINIEGNLAPSNSFKEIIFGEVKKKLNISKIDVMSYLKVADNSFSTKDNEIASGEAIIVPENSFLYYDGCTLIDPVNKIYSCDFDEYGILSISTGKGINRLLENHPNNFKSFSLKKRALDINVIDTTNKKDFFIPQNDEYALSFESDGDSFFDIGIEWTSKLQSTTVISFPYPYDKVFGLRPFGGLILPSESIQALKNANEISFFIDRSRKEVFVKLFNRQNHDKIIIYADVHQNNDETPYTINKKKKTIAFAYPLQKGTFTTLKVKDINGNTIKTLVEGVQRKKSVEASFNIDQLNLKRELRFFELTIGDKIYRGPLYAN
ncbi:hypothetical protein GTQ40_17965 [Flavobacteriaceae bacterium R38]|nr:hypothetical protein [Flavobacteriaceae bacterium R38]